jgi:hypothetical protein
MFETNMVITCLSCPSVNQSSCQGPLPPLLCTTDSVSSLSDYTRRLATCSSQLRSTGHESPCSSVWGKVTRNLLRAGRMRLDFRHEQGLVSSLWGQPTFYWMGALRVKRPERVTALLRFLSPRIFPYGSSTKMSLTLMCCRSVSCMVFSNALENEVEGLMSGSQFQHKSEWALLEIKAYYMYLHDS